MNEIKGLKEAFQKAKVVYFTTYYKGEERSRQMTNFNMDPYTLMWFPSYRKTKKVEDIKLNQKVLITFPGSVNGEFFEIEGKAEFASKEEVINKWEWWYLYWHPHQKSRFWFPSGQYNPDRVIINVHPMSSRLVKKT
jgi:general stress protein 26